MKILIVDDNQSSADALARALTKKGHEARACYDGATAIEHLDVDPPDIVFTDLRMEPIDGMAVVRAARARRPPVDIVVFTAYGAVETAVEALHLGARDFLTKPVSLEQIVARLGSASAALNQTLDGFTPASEQAHQLREDIRRAASARAHVWIEGEIGSGRAHAARYLHALTNDPTDLHVVDPTREFSWPSGGTVLLSNIDDLPDDLQRQLARRLQHAPKALRIVATAGPDARQRVAEGTLRSDLYFGLAVVVLQVPPLRERPDDIIPLLNHALASYAERYRRDAPRLTEDQSGRLLQHAWPGNVRELLNIAERAIVMGPGALDMEVVRRTAPGLPNLEPGFSLSSYLETIERRLLMEALRRSGGDRAAAGRLLGVERNTLRYKLNKYDLLDR